MEYATEMLVAFVVGTIVSWLLIGAGLCVVHWIRRRRAARTRDLSAILRDRARR